MSLKALLELEDEIAQDLKKPIDVETEIELLRQHLPEIQDTACKSTNRVVKIGLKFRNFNIEFQVHKTTRNIKRLGGDVVCLKFFEWYEGQYVSAETFADEIKYHVLQRKLSWK